MKTYTWVKIQMLDDVTEHETTVTLECSDSGVLITDRQTVERLLLEAGYTPEDES